MRQGGEREWRPSGPNSAPVANPDPANPANRTEPEPAPEDELSEWTSREVEGLLRVVAEEPLPEPDGDLVRRTLDRVRAMRLLRDLAAFATFESIWESVRRRRKR